MRSLAPRCKQGVLISVAWQAPASAAPWFRSRSCAAPSLRPNSGRQTPVQHHQIRPQQSDLISNRCWPPEAVRQSPPRLSLARLPIPGAGCPHHDVSLSVVGLGPTATPAAGQKQTTRSAPCPHPSTPAKPWQRAKTHRPAPPTATQTGSAPRTPTARPHRWQIDPPVQIQTHTPRR